MVYTDVKRLDGNFKDAHNYIVTAPAIDGPWSDPIYVNSSGFDPSLFHEDDGSKWFLNMQWNHRGNSVGGNPKHPAFDGILCQQWQPEKGLLGETKNIFPGSDHGLVEAPHLYKRAGWYYLTVAEGGTGYEHAVTMALSRELLGPYELHPDTHLLTSKDTPESSLQRVGHGQIVETSEGEVYHTYLCTRPLQGRFSPLGRETGIAKCEWRDDGWLYSLSGRVPQLLVESPLPVEPEPATESVCYFDSDVLPSEFQWLRTPEPERLFRLTGQALRLFGRESVGSWFEQSLVARRQEHHIYRAQTKVHFEPKTYQQLAGLTTYYNRHKFHLLAVSWHESVGRCLTMLSCLGEWADGNLDHIADPVPLAPGPVELAVLVNCAELQFYWRQEGPWQAIGQSLDASVISDEGGRGEHASVTGAFVGMIAIDITGQALAADFPEFIYTPNPD